MKGERPSEPADGPTGRRGTYFAFQGLLMAVLLLLFIYQHRAVEHWGPRFAFLASTLGGSLLFIRLVSSERLSDWRVQTAVFLFDAGMASLTLHWIGSRTELFLLYCLILFGTALTRDLKQSLAIGAVTSGLYLLAFYAPARGLPDDPAFWLRFCFLWTVTILLALLAHDSKRLRAESEDRYRERVLQVERLAALGRMAGEVAHRIKGPLTTILVNAEVLGGRVGLSGRAKRELEQIRDEVIHCREILKSLLELGRIEETVLSPMDLRDSVRSSLASVDPQARLKGLRVETSGLEARLSVLGDRSLLHEAVAAVLQNAVDASPEGGRVRVALRRERGGSWWGGPEPGRLVVEITDEGRGIAPEDLERVFQPFFTTKGGEGTGLGLSAALRILQKHGGTVEAHSEGPASGARFTLVLPEKS